MLHLRRIKKGTNNQQPSGDQTWHANLFPEHSNLVWNPKTKVFAFRKLPWPTSTDGPRRSLCYSSTLGQQLTYKAPLFHNGDGRENIEPTQRSEGYGEEDQWEDVGDWSDNAYGCIGLCRCTQCVIDRQQKQQQQHRNIH